MRQKPGWRLVDFRELWEYRDLFFFLVWRDIKARYAQSVLGVGWTIIRPVMSMIVFTVVFGGLVKVSSDGAPYAIFSYAALVPWTYFSTAITDAADSLIRNRNMLTKVYFPRLIMPMSSVLGKLIDFVIAPACACSHADRSPRCSILRAGNDEEASESLNRKRDIPR